MVKTQDTPARSERTSAERDGPGRIVRAIGILGRVLVACGLVLLFYTTYLLWGTGVYTKAAQQDLSRQLESNPIVSSEQVRSGEVPPARPAADPALGDGLFKIEIPKIGLSQVVVQGVGREELKKGPGHFVDSPYPGEKGNVAISGHRTTYGAPFFKLNEVQPGDTIDIVSGPARYRYVVREQKVVSPYEVHVVEDHGVDELTLTTCHPRFSAAQRLIVHADYEGASLLEPQGPPPSADRPSDDGAGGGEEERTLVPASPPPVPQDVAILAAVAIAALIGAMSLSDRLRKPAIWTAVVLGGAAGLWTVVFPQVLQMMPANY